MGSSVHNTANKEAVKEKIIEIIEQNDISYSISECCDGDRLCIDFREKDKCEKCRCGHEIVVQTIDKNICRIYPQEILYIAIEGRRSVLYLADGKIETGYSLEYWKDILSLEHFAQPHYSFLVNLKYVDEVTKDWVKVRYGENLYKVYTSQRKIGAFKKALLELGRR